VRAEGIDHATVLERLSEAALERDGIGRLIAADPAVAAHLASCRSCAAERDAWLRTSDALADALRRGAASASGRGAGSAAETGGSARAVRGGEVARAEPATELPPDLRARTLAWVAEHGMARSAEPVGRVPALAPGSAPAPASPALGTRQDAAETATVGSRPVGDSAPLARRHPARRRRRILTLLAAAAVVALLVGGGGLLADLARQRDVALQERDQAHAEAQQLARVTGVLDALLVEPGSRLAPLASTATGQTVGSVVWGPGSNRLAVVVDALAAPPSGSAYRCWVERDGVRHVIGEMRFGEGLAYWAGWVDPASGIGPGSRFGVSLVSAAGGGGEAPAVLLATF
jgi:hypothetical protein